MGTNFEKFLQILSKWPTVMSRKEWDYGHHLRQLVKQKDIHGNVFPGSSAENTKMLNSLARILNNTHKNTYPCSIQGASGVDEDTAKEFINSRSMKLSLKKGE